VEHHKRRWSVIYEGDVGSAWEWCQIELHTSCDVPAPLNHLKTTVVDGARLSSPSCVSCSSVGSVGLLSFPSSSFSKGVFPTSSAASSFLSVLLEVFI